MELNIASNVSVVQLGHFVYDIDARPPSKAHIRKAHARRFESHYVYDWVKKKDPEVIHKVDYLYILLRTRWGFGVSLRLFQIHVRIHGASGSP